MKATKIVFALVLAMVLTGAASAQMLCPPGVPGEFLYVPFPVKITLDGKLDDWGNIPKHKNVLRLSNSVGPAIPGEDESFEAAFAADDTYCYVMFSVVDNTIVTGKNGNDWYQEDSCEFYINYNDKLTQTAFNKKTLQLNIKPIDIGNKDPKTVRLTGIGVDRFGFEALVFKTDKGWGFEGRFALDKKIELKHGFTWGTNLQLNGTKAPGGRTTKLGWSKLDPDDKAWQQPKLWGKAVMYKVGSTDEPKPNK